MTTTKTYIITHYIPRYLVQECWAITTPSSYVAFALSEVVSIGLALYGFFIITVQITNKMCSINTLHKVLILAVGLKRMDRRAQRGVFHSCLA